MGSELTATVSVAAPNAAWRSHPLYLIEHFRSAWTCAAPPHSASRPRTVLVAGNPNHQLAHGLLAVLHENARDLVVSNDRLALLASRSGRRLVSISFSADDAAAVYAACAKLWVVRLRLFDWSSVHDGDIDLAQNCGLNVVVADQRTEVSA